MEFDVELGEYRGLPVMRLSGELDPTVHDMLRTRMHDLADRHSRAMVDLTRVSYLDSTSLGLLLDGHERIRRRGGRMALVCPSGDLLHLLDVAGISAHVGMFGGMAEAAEFLEGEPAL